MLHSIATPGSLPECWVRMPFRKSDKNIVEEWYIGIEE